MKLTSKTPTQAGRASQQIESISELREQIRLRASELYEQRGRKDGHDLEDWYQAESEMTPKKVKTVSV
jgi:hypothetical protein